MFRFPDLGMMLDGDHCVGLSFIISAVLQNLSMMSLGSEIFNTSGGMLSWPGLFPFIGVFLEVNLGKAEAIFGWIRKMLLGWEWGNPRGCCAVQWLTVSDYCVDGSIAFIVWARMEPPSQVWGWGQPDVSEQD